MSDNQPNRKKRKVKEEIEVRPLNRRELFYRERGERFEWENLESLISISGKLFFLSMAFVFGNYHLVTPDRVSISLFFLSGLLSFFGLIPIFGKKIPLISIAIIEEVQRLSFVKWRLVVLSSVCLFMGILVQGYGLLYL